MIKRPLLRAFLLLAVAGWCAQARADRVLGFGYNTGMSLPNSSALKFGSNDFCFEFWVNPNNKAGETGTILASDTLNNLGGGNGLYSGLGLFVNGATLQVGFRGVGLSGGVLSPVTLSTGAWHHVALNFSRVDKISLYIDGKVATSFAINTSNYSYDSATNPFQLGAAPPGSAFFNGSIAELRVWKRVRTAGEISNAYSTKGVLNGDETGLSAYYKFNEASGNALALGAIGAAGNTGIGTAVRVVDSTIGFGAVIPPISDYALYFNGINQTVQTPVPGSSIAGNEFTIEYWYKGNNMQSAVRLQNATSWVVPAWNLNKTAALQALYNDGANSLALNLNGNAQNGIWHYHALTFKRNTSGGFAAYMDGQLSASMNTPDAPVPPINSRFWLGSNQGASEYTQGYLEEVRIWKRALTSAEILDHYQNPARLYGFEPGLVAYFPFNDAQANGTADIVSGSTATFTNLTSTNRVIQSDINFPAPVPVLSPNPALAGLWAGEISLQGVSDVVASPGTTTPANSPFSFNILMHADSNGVVRLLQDVTIMQNRSTVSNVTDTVLITDDALLANYEGVLKRGGKMVGVRYSSAFYQFPGQSLTLAGGLGIGFRVQGTNLVSATLPTNPFFHKYHPNHKNPQDLQGNAYDITRVIDIQFNNYKTATGDGRDRLTGTYKETITGLHKVPLITDGTLTLNRISLVNKLNNQ